MSFVAWLAGLVGRAMEEQPDTFAPYLAAGKGAGADAASQLLCRDIADSASELTVAWSKVRHGLVDDEATARHAFLLLLATDGWSRIKQCQHPDCHLSFADATNARTRRRCRRHTRRHARRERETP